MWLRTLLACTLPILASGLATGHAFADDESRSNKPVFHANVYAPPHISEEWQHLFETYQPFWEVPDQHDLDGWRAWDESKQINFIKRDTPLIEKYGVKLREVFINGVRVLEITPGDLKFENKSLMYMHGGGWASFSPESTLADTVPMAAELGIRVYSVDYTKAPFATLYEIIEENVAVFEHLVDEHEYQAKDIGVYGCSAGGHLALAISNALRNRGAGIPGAAVANSPMVDFTMTNDTWVTLEGQDPLIAREAYVRKLLPILGIENYRDPVISPHLDKKLSEGMPPTLLQTGGKELLLSDSLVMFQALEAAGQTAKLDLYDGMPHCFPFIFPDSREGKIAFAKQVAWFREYLRLN